MKLKLKCISVKLHKLIFDAHQRVRLASKQKGVQTYMEPNLSPDVLGIYVYLPKAST